MSDLHLVAMPKWGLSMEEGVVVGWHKQPGDAVAKGDELIDVETTKITNTVEAPVAGTLLTILAATGETAACGAALAVIGPADAGAAQVDQFVAEYGAQRADAVVESEATPEPVTAVVERDGQSLRIRYLDVGAGPTLVLLHGFGGDLENWMFNQPALATRMRVIAIDMPAHGGSEKHIDDGSAAALAEVVAALLDDIAPGQVHLVGHSFGAVVARTLATARPERVASFTAIAPADLGTVNLAYVDGFIGARRRSDMSAAICLLFANPDLATREMAEALLRYKRLDGVDRALRAIAAANFTTAGTSAEAVMFWRKLGTKGLLIWGTHDAVVPLAGAQIEFPDVTKHIVEGAGHMPHLEKFEAVNAAIARHVADHSSQTDTGGTGTTGSGT
jgi:pyruvate dehydrogenase E2 component (dihydrolipoamide acetyltransferase)